MHFVDANLCVCELVTNQPVTQGYIVLACDHLHQGWYLVMTSVEDFSLGCKMTGMDAV